MDQRHPSQSAVILTALPVEYKAVRSHIADLKTKVHPEGTVYECGTFTSPFLRWDIGLVETRMGNARAAFEAERAIDHFKPDVVLFVGVAGGLKDVRIGDVVAVSKVYGYEYVKATEENFQTRPEVGISTYRMIQRAQIVSRDESWLKRVGAAMAEQPEAIVAPIAAGEKIVASTHSPSWLFLREHYGDAVAVEMEGYGFLQAVHGNHHIEALIIRGVSDLIDGKQNADASGSQKMAARHASAFAFEVLSQLNADDFHGRAQNTTAPKEPPQKSSPTSKYTIQQHTQSGTIIAPIGDNASVHLNKPHDQNNT